MIEERLEGVVLHEKEFLLEINVHLSLLILYDIKNQTRIYQFSIPGELPLNYNITDNFIILSFFKMSISFILDPNP